jgi:hypothetical protein
LIQRDGLFETSISEYQTKLRHVTYDSFFVVINLDRPPVVLISYKPSGISLHVSGIETCGEGGLQGWTVIDLVCILCTMSEETRQTLSLNETVQSPLLCNSVSQVLI